MMSMTRSKTNLAAWQIMNYGADRETRHGTAWDCHRAIRNVTDYADWWESGVLFEDTLNAQAIMEEATK